MATAFHLYNTALKPSPGHYICLCEPAHNLTQSIISGSPQCYSRHLPHPFFLSQIQLAGSLVMIDFTFDTLIYRTTYYIFSAQLYMNELLTLFCFPFLFKCRKQVPRVEGIGYCSTILLRSSIPFLFPARRSKAFTNLSYASCNSQYCLYSFQFFYQGYALKLYCTKDLSPWFLPFYLRKNICFILLTIKLNVLYSLFRLT